MKNRINKLINIITVVVLLASGVVLLEMMARLAWHYKYNKWLEKELHGFERIDYRRGIIIPKENTIETVKSYKEDLMKFGKTLGLKYFYETAPYLTSQDDSTVLFSNNKYGFKGPEISMPKPDSVFRILTIGDSCTWGPPSDYYSYPRIMERELSRLIDNKFRIEVVNAGVYGYNFERVIKRIDEFLAIDPDLIIIYLGWNRTIFRADIQKNMFLYRNLALYKIFYHLVVNRKDTGLNEDYSKTTFYNTRAIENNKFQAYNFNYDINDLDVIIRKIKDKNKSIKVMLITLAGLFDLRVNPDQRSLDIGYPIASTNNLYILSLLTAKFNSELRNYARSEGLPIIDFELYALENFVPRSRYFFDSVHPTIEGYLKMGRFFANEIIRILNLQKVKEGHY
ncbi:MAG: SGNH/GDSL hydrolase family protein [Candidatus Omnitrophota bacterium]|nr:SGNH/GDSL hydrolase family protein [Candidatus Omnitrophota bacterium]